VGSEKKRLECDRQEWRKIDQSNHYKSDTHTPLVFMTDSALLARIQLRSDICFIAVIQHRIRFFFHIRFNITMEFTFTTTTWHYATSPHFTSYDFSPSSKVAPVLVDKYHQNTQIPGSRGEGGSGLARPTVSANGRAYGRPD